ncbi:hypothetical protein DOM21_08170 [Bacteriovorax stolpii]|uniref:hypothetical protein n=1 Tax=Bacteriovorax stolpii TaxID=960 RepID=UPI0011588036|nr:hypothetical protein [Bacteriovorax stolpii]QDK41431.1 hypothetical protein DOM21_08170 [Bacteriovorax stolpii]
MKAVLSAALVFSLTISSSFAGTARTVNADVKALGQLAMGWEEHSVKGKNAEEILKNYVEENYGEERELVFKEYSDMAYGDEIDEGFTSTKSAILMSAFAESALEEMLEGLDESSEAEKIKEIKANIYDLNHSWAPVIKRLERQGVKFGYSGNGPGYCGISFVELLIVDEKEQKVYEVYLSEGGSC